MRLAIQCKNWLKMTPLGIYALKVRRNLKGTSKKCAYKAISDFGHSCISPEDRNNLLVDMRNCTKKYHFSYAEYFLFNLQSKTESERKEFISDSERVEICERFNDKRNQIIFDDKYLTSLYFKEYLGRECLLLHSANDHDAVCQFLKAHGRVIAKPLSSSCGQGIEIYSVDKGSDIEQMANIILKKYCHGLFGAGILEEVIVQDPLMEELHPASVNTVRIPTIRLNDRIVIFHPFLRVGRGESVVDNAGAGGIICALDAESGIVISARDEKGVSYTNHPDTNTALVGMQVPRWDEAVEFARKLAEVIPTNRYTGWDCALTLGGWKLVEGNARGQFVAQIPLQMGFRSEVESYLDQIEEK